MIPLLIAHWRKLAVLALLAAVFFAGRASMPELPARVETVEKIIYRDRIVEVEKRVEVKAEQQTKVIYRTITKDRTVEVERTESATQATATTDRTATRDTSEVTERVVTVEAARPQWRVGVQAGLDLRTTRPLQLEPGTPTLGLTVERRIAGGLSAGLWAQHRFDAGPPLPVIGLSLSYEF